MNMMFMASPKEHVFDLDPGNNDVLVNNHVLLNSSAIEAESTKREPNKRAYAADTLV